MAWGFLTNHAQALLCIAQDPGVRLREIASTLGITERAAYGIVTDLVEAEYVHKDKTRPPQPLQRPGRQAPAGGSCSGSGPSANCWSSSLTPSSLPATTTRSLPDVR